MGWLDWLFRPRRQEPAEGEIAPRPSAAAVSEVSWTEDSRGWLHRPITVEEAEARHPGLAGDPRAAQHPHIVRPFGFQSPEWDALKAQIRPGDELREFVSPREDWAHLAGRAGIELVRDGEKVAEIVTMMN